MGYRIKYNYQTGDSERTNTHEELLEATWENLDVSKANLKRIGEHYKWYEYVEEPRWADTVIPRPEWYPVNSPEEERYRSSFHHSIILKMDNGEDWRFQCPWCGYFESLNSAEIIIDQSDMKIEF